MAKFITAFLTIFKIAFAAPNIHSFKLEDIDGHPLDLKKYQGKPLLIVNIATQCGYTPQLEDLEKLYKKFKDRGLEVVGVPSNDFGGQTPEENKDVAKFCRLNYGVSFPLTEKSTVKGENKSKLYHHLTTLSKEGEVKWNFEKFLFDGKGNLRARYNSKVQPLNSELEKEIVKLLNK